MLQCACSIVFVDSLQRTVVLDHSTGTTASDHRTAPLVPASCRLVPPRAASLAASLLPPLLSPLSVTYCTLLPYRSIAWPSVSRCTITPVAGITAITGTCIAVSRCTSRSLPELVWRRFRHRGTTHLSSSSYYLSAVKCVHHLCTPRSRSPARTRSMSELKGTDLL